MAFISWDPAEMDQQIRDWEGCGVEAAWAAMHVMVEDCLEKLHSLGQIDASANPSHVAREFVLSKQKDLKIYREEKQRQDLAESLRLAGPEAILQAAKEQASGVPDRKVGLWILDLLSGVHRPFPYF